MNKKLDKYDILLEKLGYGINNSNASDADVEVDNDSLTELMNELGISMSNDEQYKLIIWNDHVNDMVHVSVALYEICGLNNDQAIATMLEAHKNGKAVAKKGSKEEMMKMKQGLNDRNIEATVEK